MGKRKSAVLIDSDDSRSSDSDSGSGSDLDTKEMMAARKKGGAKTSKAAKMETFTSSSGSSGSDSDSDEGEASNKSASGKKSGGPAPVGKRKPAKRARRSTSGTTQSSVTSSDEDDEKASSERSPSAEVSSSSRSVPGPPSSSVVSSTVPNNGAEKKEQTQSDLEEGEVSDDEEAAGESSEAEEFNDGYDENMMGDDEDQRRLSAMTEKEREQEIYKRIELRDSLRHRFELNRKLKRKLKLEARKANKKGKLGGGVPSSSSTVGEIASTLSIDEEPSSTFSSIDMNSGSGFLQPSSKDEFQMDAKVRSQERKKTVEAKTDKKTQAMDALKATRDAKIQRAQEKEKEKIRKEAELKRDDDDDDDLGMKKDDDGVSSVGDKRHQKKLKTSDIYSDDSEGSDSGSEDGSTSIKKDRKVKKEDSGSSSSSSDSEDEVRHKKPQYIEKTEDLNRIRMSRFKLERWVYYPMFSKVAKGCFVRAAMAKGTMNTYKVCEILEVVEGPRIYQLGALRTNKVLLLSVNGNPDHKTRLRFEFISNTTFTDDEFGTYKLNCATHNQVLPTLDDITKKEKEIKALIEYQLQEEDVEAIVQEKAKFKNSPVNFAAKKTQLMKEKEMAITNGEDERVASLTSEIHDLDERAKELDKARTSTISSISYINERNRKKNVEEAEKAILEELKTTRGLKIEDPFTRRNTKPRIVSKPNAFLNGPVAVKLDGGVDEPTSTTADMIDGLTPIALLETPDSLDLDLKKELESSSSIGDLFSAHDFDIKLDLDAKLPPANLPILARPSVTPIKETAPRRSLNLEEYKRKKGLI